MRGPEISPVMTPAAFRDAQMLRNGRLRQTDGIYDVAADAARRRQQQPQDAQPRRMRQRLGQFRDIDVRILHAIPFCSLIVDRRFNGRVQWPSMQTDVEPYEGSLPNAPAFREWETRQW